MLDKVDEIIIGGGLAFTFLKVLNNMKIGESLYDEEGAILVTNFMKAAEDQQVPIHLPVDVAGDQFSEAASVKEFKAKEGIPQGWMGLDLGAKTCKKFAEVIEGAETILWNGPVGVFEFPNFAQGTKLIMDQMGEATERGPTTIIAGGDTGTCVQWESAPEGEPVASWLRGRSSQKLGRFPELPNEKLNS